MAPFSDDRQPSPMQIDAKPPAIGVCLRNVQKFLEKVPPNNILRDGDSYIFKIEKTFSMFRSIKLGRGSQPQHIIEWKVSFVSSRTIPANTTLKARGKLHVYIYGGCVLLERLGEVTVCKEQELKQSEPNPAITIKTRNY